MSKIAHISSYLISTAAFRSLEPNFWSKNLS